MSHFEIWEAYMRSYDFLTQVDSYAQNIRDLAAAVEIRPGTNILDAGSGTGNLSIALKARGAHVVSCDFSPSALKKHLAKDPGANVLRASLEDPLPLPDGGFDAVCCASVLFTLTKRGCRCALGEFSRVLKPGGQLMVTVPAPDQRNSNLIGLHWRGLVRKTGAVRGTLRSLCDAPALAKILYYNRQLARLPDWQGFHRFTEAELCQFLSCAGFENASASRTYGGRFLFLAAKKIATPVPLPHESLARPAIPAQAVAPAPVAV